MDRQPQRMVHVLVWTLMVCTAPGVVMADYAIDWYRIDAGGLTSSGGEFVLTGTLERAEPNVVVMAGADFELTGSLLQEMDDDAMTAADGEGAVESACGSGVDQALPLLMVFGIGAVSATASRRRRLRP
jgi:hypothetical protein